jgi:glutamate racemase
MSFVAKIVVFDSGVGSLSIIQAIQKISKSEIIYFADQANFPYGEKSQVQLSKIIKKSIKILREKFNPDIIVMASNTPSLMLNLATRKIIDVKPPLKDAQKKSKTKQFAILATNSAVRSKGLARHIKQNGFPKKNNILKIDGSELVEVVESGKFHTDKKHCRKIIKNVLDKKLFENDVDLILLSSTHLSFLRSFLEKEYPKISFVDPADEVARKVLLKIKDIQNERNSLKIFASGNVTTFQRKLERIGIKNKVNFLSI